MSEKMEAAFEGRQIKGIKMMNDGVEVCQAVMSETMESKAVRQWRLRRSKLGSRDDRDADQEKSKVGHVLANKTYLFVL